MRRTHMTCLLLLLLSGGLVGPAQAALVDGDVLRITWLFPDKETVFPFWGPEDVVVGPGVEVVGIFDQINIDVNAGLPSIVFTFTEPGSFSFGEFNGFSISDPTGTVWDFLDVEVNQNNMPGFGPDRLSLEPDAVFINFASLEFDAQTILALDVESVPEPAPIPEPATLGLLGAGLVAVALRARRRGSGPS